MRLFLAPLLLLAALSPDDSFSSPEYLPWGEAAPIVTTAGPTLPAELVGKSEPQLAALWPDWIRRQDSRVRERLAQGEEDSLINLLVYGASFTRAPRLTAEFFERTNSLPAGQREQHIQTVVATRVRDLTAAVAGSPGSERVDFIRRLLLRKGYRFDSAADRALVAKFLLNGLDRVVKEMSSYAAELQNAKRAGDIDQIFAVRSRLYAARGVSLDTSWQPNLAVEQALRQLLTGKLLPKDSANRLAVIGPGLDFVDKSEGYDFYPVQTFQPFALMDSALRLGLADPQRVRVTSLDISERVNQHLARLHQQAEAGAPYRVQLLRPAKVAWTPESISYWEHFGDRVGTPTLPVHPPPTAGKLLVRAVQIRPEFARRVSATDLNIVYQRLPLPPEQRFDVIIGTNIFVYYGVFEQALAVANASRMLRSGGILLSNHVLPEPPSAGMESLGYIVAVYSDRPDDGDQIFIYRKRQ
jgi:hypothetical protein